MITLRRSAERHHVQAGLRNVWSTFHSERSRAPVVVGFETLMAFDEGLIPPGASVPLFPLHDAEVITYVFEGALACKRPTGRSGVTYAGEFQHGSAVGGHLEANASQSAWARIFQISLRPLAGRARHGGETERFSIAQRRGVLCMIASHDGRRGSLRLDSDAQVHSAVLDSGRHLACELAPRSRAWLHVVAGEVQVGDAVLAAGDGAGISEEHAVSLISRDASEILLVVLAEPREGISGAGLAP